MSSDSSSSKLTVSEIDTILCALRAYQRGARCSPDCEHTDESHDLTAHEIDDLCERLNLSSDVQLIP